MKKKSQLLAEFMHYGEQIIPIEASEYWNECKEHISKLGTTSSCAMKDLSSDTMMFSVDGCDYYFYGSMTAHDDGDSFYFRIKRSTAAERLSFMKIMCQENDYTLNSL
jgi:hypothetical protein